MIKRLNISKTSQRLSVFLIVLAFFIFPPKNVLASGGLIINELMYDLPGTDDKHEWVEFYNAGTQEVDLTDWKFNDGDTATNHALNPPPKNNSRGSLTIPAGGYLLLAGDAVTVAADLPSFSGTIIDTVMNLNNTSAPLKLLDQNGAEIDSILYAKELGAAGNGKTLERDGDALKESLIDGGTPGKANSVLNPAAFVNLTPSPSASPSLSQTSSPTPAPSASQSAYQFSQDILINEFLPYPVSDDPEWVELYNGGDETITLTGWQINDSQETARGQQIPTDTKIAPGEYLVISFSKALLNNDGDTIKLLWPDNQTVHAISYQQAKQNFSCMRDDNGQWLWTSQPTPGQLNKLASPAPQNNASPNSLSATPAITPIIETVVVATKRDNAPSPASEAPRSGMPENLPSPAVTPQNESNHPPIAASQEVASRSKPKTVFVLLGIIILAAGASLLLVYFRHKTIDRPAAKN
jgi:hypothetical protein